MFEYLDNIKIKDRWINDSFRLEKAYLLSLDVNRLLAGFRSNAGLISHTLRYKGWESTEIQGHTMGHYLSAMAQAWHVTKEPVIMARIRRAIAGLEECQRPDGFLFASSSILFDRIEKQEEAWVPWYTMHKILAGLVSVCQLTGDERAFDVMTRLADWIADRVLAWSEETKAIVLAVEYGGMNDSLYDVYELRGEEKYFQAAHQFDEMQLFDAMYRGEDILDGLHANTTIPKITGGLKRYMVSGEKEPFYLQMAENFWEIVVRHHTYITGGNSEWEHFGKADGLDGERTACNCETCNTYNMLKLSQMLFALTGKKKYADYDEWTYINAILSSQNHKTGMSMYFQPMATGYFKVYSRPYDQFWCCTGTGMENFTKPYRGITFTDENTLYINRFVSSEINWEQRGLTLEMDVDLLKSEVVSIRIKRIADGDGDVRVAVRVPHWTAGKYNVSGMDGSFEELDGYIYFNAKKTQSLALTFCFPMDLEIHPLQDNPRAAAFSYGPFALSSALGYEYLHTETTGVDVTIPTKDMNIEDYIVLNAPVSEWKRVWKRDKNGDSASPHFKVHSADGRILNFAPHFLKNGERYGLYYYLVEH